MEILVIGGSYFLGRHFVEMASKSHHITTFNRGHQKINLPNVTEIYGDRNVYHDIAQLNGMNFDVVVDTCAYNANEINNVFNILEGHFNKYIFISTVDVLRHGTSTMLGVNSPYETKTNDSYILGKISLEGELMKLSRLYNKNYTILRPAILYGPYNYAPREQMYYNQLRKNQPLIVPSNATGEFQMVYVKDVARAMLTSCEKNVSNNKIYILAPNVTINYKRFAETFVRASYKNLEIKYYPLDEFYTRRIPLPFPERYGISEKYLGEKARELIGKYTTLDIGLEETIRWYMNY